MQNHSKYHFQKCFHTFKSVAFKNMIASGVVKLCTNCFHLAPHIIALAENMLCLLFHTDRQVSDKALNANFRIDKLTLFVTSLTSASSHLIKKILFSGSFNQPPLYVIKGEFL